MENTYVLTESEIHKLINDAIQQIMEDAGAGGATAGGFGGGALGGSNLMDGSSDESGGVARNALGGKKKDKSVIDRGSVYTPKNSDGKVNTVDMSDATARHNGKGGSISIPKR